MVKHALLDELCKKEENNKPVVINVVAKRVRQLFRGDKPLVEDRHLTDQADVAVKEFLEGKLQIKKKEEK